ncbi:MAG: CRISPR-associated protein Cas4 [Promethearchaeota archaeon]
MNNIKIENLKEYCLNKHQLDEIRKNYPMVNLYESPLIGTEEVRQYCYCKRIIFFRHILHSPMKQTYKMEYGAKKHEKLQKIANKSEEKYAQKYYNIYLTDSQTGLVGLIDYFEFDGKEAYPVEIKSGNMPPEGHDNPHKYQVTAQAILIEKNFDFLVKKVRVFYSKYNKVIEYPIGIEDKLKVMNIIKKIRRLIESEKIPEPTKNKGKCIDCECKNYCLRG